VKCVILAAESSDSHQTPPPEPRAHRVLRSLRKKDIEKFSLVEIGAAYGWFCEEIISSDPHARVLAVEPSFALSETCKSKGIETQNVPIESLNLDEQVDVVAAFEVIEHIFSPKEFVGHMSRILKPGGAIFISCPNLYGFDVEVLGLMSSAFQHEHLNYFTPSSIELLLTQNGFHEINVSTPGKLDVDIVKKHFDDDIANLNEQKFLRRMLSKSNSNLMEAFQNFLADHGLSSHMWVEAKKL
jgi:SAM-dependent methyltransferase